MKFAISVTPDRFKLWTHKAIDMQAGRLFLWLPVAFGAGAALYLALLFEPSWWWVVLPTILMFVVVWLIRRMNWNSYLYGFALLLLFFSLGMTVCKLRAEHVRAPVLDPSQTNYSLQAFVIDNVSASEDAPRLLLAPIAMRGVDLKDVPLRIRVSLRPGIIEAAGIKPGDAISMFAILNPPPPPNMPGGYDFARGAYFQGIGGVGLVPGTPQVIPAPKRGWQLDFLLKLNRLRWSITHKIVADITPEFSNGRAMGGFAAALVTGQQAFIPQSLTQNMRDSGLAHILSISGVHMAVVGGFIFFGLRFLMALIPPLALRLPVKKLAAALSIVCILLYLAISGSPAPAVRSAVVACVAFGAILVDRRALSLRALAIAAIVVLILTPEAVVQPGFQMSFSATAALLALAETMTPAISELSVPAWVRFIQKGLHGLWLSLVASVVATLATTPFAIAYFNRFSVYGLASNLFEAPITSFIVMPFLALGTVLSATPLGWLCLRIAGGGLWLIDRIADLTAHLPHAVINWPSAPAYVLPLSFLGLIWICLVRGKGRWLGLFLASSIMWWPRVAPPDIWIDSEGGNAAVRTGATAYVLRPKVRQYGFEQWTHHYGLSPVDAEGYVCQGYGCAPLATAKYRVGFWFSNKPPNDKRLLQLCQSSDLVVMRNPVGDWPAVCQGVNHISSGDFDRMGALELTRRDKTWLIRASQPLRGKRYWSTRSEEEGSDAGY